MTAKAAPGIAVDPAAELLSKSCGRAASAVMFALPRTVPSGAGTAEGGADGGSPDALCGLVQPETEALELVLGPGAADADAGCENVPAVCNRSSGGAETEAI